MAIKLKRIHIKNFKPFEDYQVEFNSENLIVFDGPNGFGKTSFYDAIELLITGSLRRYNDLVDSVVDRRRTSSGNPWLNDNATGDLVIRGELEAEGQIVCLERKGLYRDLIANNIGNVTLRLYEVESFDEEKSAHIEDEEQFLNKLLGKNYLQNFEYLNYIEQEENIYLLKYKEKDRKGAIAHLFNTEEFDQKIEHLTQSSKKLGKVCGNDAKNSLLRKKSKLSEYKEKLLENQESKPYQRIILWQEINWDVEELEFSDGQYVDWLGERGSLKELENFVLNIKEFKSHEENKRIDDLLSKEKSLTDFLLYSEFWNSIGDYKTSLDLEHSIDKLLSVFEQGLLDGIRNNRFLLSSQIKALISSQIDINDFSELLADISSEIASSDAVSQVLVVLKESRKIFMEKFYNYEAESDQYESCPLCGYDWESAEKLKEGFELQTKKLETLIKESGSKVNEKLNNLTVNYILPIKKCLEEYKSTHSIDELFINELIKTSTKQPEYTEIRNQLEKLEIDLAPFLNYKPLAASTIDFQSFRETVNRKKQVINIEISPSFRQIFLRVFDESYDNVFKLDVSEISDKRKYIEWKYSLYQNKNFNKLNLEYEEQKTVLLEAKSTKAKVDKLKRIYSCSLMEYQKEIIENIEILFHIYSGRIAQEGKGSLGLFIDADVDGIRFLENHSKNHDAIFTMSSGQLATLVIAFTLALNKRYSKTKVLFIDDPIQTLDELNIAGLVELLRNEFSDRQIFISTHEDVMSAYMRYKFKKYGLDHQRLNLRDSQLSSQE